MNKAVEYLQTTTGAANPKAKCFSMSIKPVDPAFIQLHFPPFQLSEQKPNTKRHSVRKPFSVS
jgi:hypothetical protein